MSKCQHLRFKLMLIKMHAHNVREVADLALMTVGVFMGLWMATWDDKESFWTVTAVMVPLILIIFTFQRLFKRNEKRIRQVQLDQVAGYTRHHFECEDNHGGRCSCGLDEALRMER